MFNWFPNYASDVPVDLQFKKAIEAKINRGEFKNGDILPSKREVRLRCSIAREYIDKAYGALHSQGLLEHIKGKGYIVKTTKV
jgi:DNA-binding GntR family transcriptional regulator